VRDHDPPGEQRREFLRDEVEGRGTQRLHGRHPVEALRAEVALRGLPASPIGR
jgi:hypothetical protein